MAHDDAALLAGYPATDAHDRASFALLADLVRDPGAPVPQGRVLARRR